MEIVQILSIILSVSILLLVIESIRRGILKEKYALLWLFASVAILSMSIWRKLLHGIAYAFGFYYPPSFLFVVGLGFLHIIAIHFSIVISSLTDKNKKLAQELGIIQEEVKRLKDSIQERERTDKS